MFGPNLHLETAAHGNNAALKEVDAIEALQHLDLLVLGRVQTCPLGDGRFRAARCQRNAVLQACSVIARRRPRAQQGINLRLLGFTGCSAGVSLHGDGER